MSVFSISRRNQFLLHSVLRHDVKASVTVFFVALPLCMGVALASGTPVYAGIAAGIIGGIVVSLFSKSELSVSGIMDELGFDEDEPIRSQTPNPLPDRAALDKVVFDALGLTDDERNEVYWSVAELVQQRLNKAASR